MPNFGQYLTPEQAAEKHKDIKGEHSVEHYRKLARRKRKCQVCGQPAWRYAGTGLCFTCTTGETDASDDYELVEEK